MEVILLADVKGVGKKNQTVTVSDGYANNFLLPRRLAVPKTKKSTEVLATQQENLRLAEEKAKAEAKILSEELKNITLEFKAKTGKDGRIFGSISTKQIADQLLNTYKKEIDKRKFIDKGPIDTLGYHRLRIELHKGIEGIINVHVSEEGK